MFRRWGINLYNCHVELSCIQADGDDPAGDRATTHDSVDDVFVNKKPNAMFVFVLATEVDLVSFFCRCFTKAINVLTFHVPMVMSFLPRVLLVGAPVSYLTPRPVVRRDAWSFLRPFRYVIQTGFHDQGVSRADLQPSGALPSPRLLTTADIYQKMWLALVLKTWSLNSSWSPSVLAFDFIEEDIRPVMSC